MKQSWRRVAIAAAVILAFTGLSTWLLPGNGTNGIAFADVLEQIRDFRPYACLYTWEYDGKPPRSYRLMRPSLSRRREVRSDGTILVFDLSQAPIRTLSLHPDRNLAVETTLLNTKPAKDPDMLRIVANIRQDETHGIVEDLGVSEIDGQLAHGFHAPDEINDFTIWADPQTGLPIRIELRQDNAERTLIMSEFEFDVDFDDSLFSTTAPDGYTVQTVERDGINPREEHLIEGLRAIATFLDGQFPATLQVQAIKEAFQEHIEQAGASPSEEEMKTLQLKTDRVIRYIMILESFRKVTDLTYAGKGVQLGDAETPVLWWLPKTAETYRVVYGDLSMTDVSPEDLPTELPEQPGFQVYVLESDPSWTRKVQSIELTAPVRLYLYAAFADDGRHFVLAQSQTFNEMLASKIRSKGRLVYTSPNGFKVWAGGNEKQYSKALLNSAKTIIQDAPSEDRVGYALESPEGTFPILAVNGPITDAELHSIADNLIPAEKKDDE